jgi:hypothetical protein
MDRSRRLRVYIIESVSIELGIKSALSAFCAPDDRQK